jgi:hypothetical protein
MRLAACSSPETTGKTRGASPRRAGRRTAFCREEEEGLEDGPLNDAGERCGGGCCGEEVCEEVCERGIGAQERQEMYEGEAGAAGSLVASSVLGEGPVTVADTSAPPAIANGGTCLFDGSKTRCPPCCSGSDASIPSGEGGSGSKQGFVESQQTAVRVTILEASWKTAFGRSDTDAEHEPLP